MIKNIHRVMDLLKKSIKRYEDHKTIIFKSPMKVSRIVTIFIMKSLIIIHQNVHNKIY